MCLLCQDLQESTEVDGLLVEDELHFLFKCSLYSEERQIWFNKLPPQDTFESWEDSEKLKYVLNRPENVKATAQFIQTAFNKRAKAISNFK